MSVFSDRIPGLVIGLSGDGTGPGIVGSLSGSWTDGTPIATSGLTFVEIPLDIGIATGGATITVRAVKRMSGPLSGDRELQSSKQSDSEETIAQHVFSASEKCVLELNLGGACDLLVVQAKTSGGIAAGDAVRGGLDYSHGRTA